MSSPDSIMDGLADLKLDRKPGADGDGAQQGDVGDPARMPLSAREFVIGASCALNMLQVHAEVGPDCQELSCNAKSYRATSRAEKLSSSAEAMCRSTGEVLAMCLEMGNAYMAVSTQDESFGEKVPIGEVRLGADEGVLRPTSQNTKEMMKSLAEEDDIPNILSKIGHGWPYSRALEIAIIQMTQAEHGMSHELIPLEKHIEVLQRFLQMLLESDITQKYSVGAECVRYCLASSFKRFRRSVISSTVEKKKLSSGEWTELKREVGKIQARLLFISNFTTAWMHPVVTVLHKVEVKVFWDDNHLIDNQLILELREISHGLSKGLISIPAVGSERRGEYYKVHQSAEKAACRVRAAADKLEGGLAVCWRFKHQVQAWWDDLGYRQQEDFKFFLMQKGKADASKSTTYVRFLHLLFTSSRAVLLLCIERLSAVLDVAPWADKITIKPYDQLRLRSLDALREACMVWDELMRQKTTVGHWAKLASTLTSGQDANIILNDCSSIGHWFRTHVQMRLSMERLKLIQRGKPLEVAVIHNESDGDIREGQAHRYAVRVLKSLVDEAASSRPYGYGFEAFKLLKTLFRKTKGCTDPTWWPGRKQADLMLRVEPHCEAILCAHWVSRQNGVEKASKLPLFGGTRPLCGSCTSYIRNSLRHFDIDEDACDRRVAGHHDAYWTCCMPAEAKEDVVQEVAEDLKMKLRDCLHRCEVLDLLDDLLLGLDHEKPVGQDQ
ncbi:hypothetical protein J7T55_008042 [Diaporthe amygdali]|uniref:uncharacterized protein n=1 Tax=Phomopsis amygdali TaxID=1214568 RepID=UPI0022FEFBD3|nr:uncharacterized protein J7T55_008042 [Diaporthe amygdali]KAJ0114206.1 hypothetical protein J7T55_008042 [Diaporthe amygdali]